jgi:hypothetical protein
MLGNQVLKNHKLVSENGVQNHLDVIGRAPKPHRTRRGHAVEWTLGRRFPSLWSLSWTMAVEVKVLRAMCPPVENQTWQENPPKMEVLYGIIIYKWGDCPLPCLSAEGSS